MTDSIAPPQAAQELCAAAVDQRLREYGDLRDRVSRLNPDVAAAKLPHDSEVPVAIICLRDAQTTLGQCLYALHEFCRRGGEHRSEGRSMMAVWTERFYVEDAAMRLYSAAEHLGSCIALLRGITDADLNEMKGASQWERVRRALKRRAGNAGVPVDPVWEMMKGVRSAKSWRAVMKYRGCVVHNQPPLLEGLGAQYMRRNRWKKAPGSGPAVLDIRPMGDSPTSGSEDVKDDIVTAFEAVLPLALHLMRELVSLLQERGIRFHEDGSLSFNVFGKS